MLLPNNVAWSLRPHHQRVRGHYTNSGIPSQVARFAALTEKGLPHESVLRELESSPDADGILVGDETRLMQIVTNLASNACKFTAAGGKLTITTKLVIPERHSAMEAEEADGEGDSDGLSSVTSISASSTDDGVTDDAMSQASSGPIRGAGKRERVSPLGHVGVARVRNSRLRK